MLHSKTPFLIYNDYQNSTPLQIKKQHPTVMKQVGGAQQGYAMANLGQKCSLVAKV